MLCRFCVCCRLTNQCVAIVPNCVTGRRSEAVISAIHVLISNRCLPDKRSTREGPLPLKHFDLLLFDTLLAKTNNESHITINTFNSFYQIDKYARTKYKFSRINFPQTKLNHAKQTLAINDNDVGYI